MPDLGNKIKQDMIKALKEKDEAKVSTLRMLQASIQQKSIENRKEELKDDDILLVIKKQVKQIQDSIEAFTKGARNDLAEKEKKSLDILKEYLPPEASDEEIKKTVAGIIDKLSSEDKPDFGEIMKSAMAALKGKADGRRVSQAVKEKLADNK
jgi:hypothetical protein